MRLFGTKLIEPQLNPTKVKTDKSEVRLEPRGDDMYFQHRHSCPSARAQLVRCFIFAACILYQCAVPAISIAEERNFAREAVTNLKAYAEYKMGNYDEARRIWQGLADKGNTTALLNLANLFQQGQGVSKDDQEAHELLAKAAALGDSRAQYELGMAYEKGHVVKRDIEKAATLLKKSADQGYADGQFSYGVMLATAHGQGLEKSTRQQRQEALQLLLKAKAAGHLEAGDYIETIRKTLD